MLSVTKGWATVGHVRVYDAEGTNMPPRFNSSKLRAAISKYNSAVRQHNSNVRRAVNEYNRAVARVNAQLRDLPRQMSRMRTQVVVRTHVTLESELRLAHQNHENGFVVREAEWEQLDEREQWQLRGTADSHSVDLIIVDAFDDEVARY